MISWYKNIWIITLLNNFTGKVVVCQWCDGVRSGADCLVYGGSENVRSWTNANRYCYQKYGGHLVTVGNATRQEALEILMQSDLASEVWIGGREALNTHWIWVEGVSIIKPQGCYIENLNIREFSVEGVVLDTLEPLICERNCYIQGYQYAAFFDGTQCYCGASFGRYGTSTNCNVKCSGDNTTFCGGPSANTVHYAIGSYAQWEDGQPNNIGGLQHCAVIDGRSNDLNFASDENCDQTYLYICKIGSCTVNRTTAEGIYVVSIFNYCYFISKIQMTWIEAHQDCLSKSGYLVKLDQPFFVNEIRELLATYDRARFGRHWIGLTKYMLQWQSGLNGLDYTNFKSGLPTRLLTGCLEIRSADGYKWTDGSCSVTKHFYCEYDENSVAPTTTTSTTSTSTTTSVPPTSTVPSSTQSTTTTTTQTKQSTTVQQNRTSPIVPSVHTSTTTSFVQTTSVTVTQSTSTDFNTPAIAAATSDSSDVALIVVLVVLLVLILLVIFCIFVVCCLRKNNDKRTVIKPEPGTFIPYTAKPDPYISSTPIIKLNSNSNSSISTDTNSHSDVPLVEKTNGKTHLQDPSNRVNHDNFQSEYPVIDENTQVTQSADQNLKVGKANHGTQTFKQNIVHTMNYRMIDARKGVEAQSTNMLVSHPSRDTTMQHIETENKLHYLQNHPMNTRSKVSPHYQEKAVHHHGTYDTANKLINPNLPHVHSALIISQTSDEGSNWTRNRKYRKKGPNDTYISSDFNSSFSERPIASDAPINRHKNITFTSNDDDSITHEKKNKHPTLKSLKTDEVFEKTEEKKSDTHEITDNNAEDKLELCRNTESESADRESVQHQEKPSFSHSKAKSSFKSSKLSSPFLNSRTPKSLVIDLTPNSGTSESSSSESLNLTRGQIQENYTKLLESQNDKSSSNSQQSGSNFIGQSIGSTSVSHKESKRKTKLCPECGKHFVMLKKHLINKHAYNEGGFKLRYALTQQN